MKSIVALSLFFAMLLFGCSRENNKWTSSPVYESLHNAGCSDYNIAALQKLNITEEETAQVVTMRNAGVAAPTVVRLFDLDRRYNRQFAIGDDIARLRNAGISDISLIDLVSLRAVADWTRDIVAMRNAGIDEQTVEELAAMKFKDGKPIIDGEELASIKNTGYSAEGIVILCRHGITEDQVQKVIKLRNEGKSENEIVAQLFP